MTEKNYFNELNQVDVSAHIEKKGPFNYVSWTHAVAELRKRHQDATWKIRDWDGAPYVETKAGCFVEVSVTVNEITLAEVYPILNNYNKTIMSPNAFEINTAIKRCLTKAIALHGIGLYVYAGEDLPPDGIQSQPVSNKSSINVNMDQIGVKGNIAGLARKVKKDIEEKSSDSQAALLAKVEGLMEVKMREGKVDKIKFTDWVYSKGVASIHDLSNDNLKEAISMLERK